MAISFMALNIFLNIFIINQINVLNKLRPQQEDLVLHCFEITGPFSTTTELYPDMICVCLCRVASEKIHLSHQSFNSNLPILKPGFNA